jgi:hypothetical protein
VRWISTGEQHRREAGGAEYLWRVGMSGKTQERIAAAVCDRIA